MKEFGCGTQSKTPSTGVLVQEQTPCPFGRGQGGRVAQEGTDSGRKRNVLSRVDDIVLSRAFAFKPRHLHT
jgi:hypothetical protein